MAATGDPHSLGQCWCGQYHLTATTWTSTPSTTVTGITPVVTTVHPMAYWQQVDPPEATTSYEGKHRSE